MKQQRYVVRTTSQQEVTTKKYEDTLNGTRTTLLTGSRLTHHIPVLITTGKKNLVRNHRR